MRSTEERRRFHRPWPSPASSVPWTWFHSRTFFAAISFCVLTCVTAQQYVVPQATLEALTPRGLRVSIPDSWGVELFAFHGNINKPMRNLEAGDLSVDITKRTGDRWIYLNDRARLKIGDVINYWIYVKVDGLGYRLDDQTWQVTELVSADTPVGSSPTFSVLPSTNAEDAYTRPTNAGNFAGSSGNFGGSGSTYPGASNTNRPGSESNSNYPGTGSNSNYPGSGSNSNFGGSGSSSNVGSLGAATNPGNNEGFGNNHGSGGSANTFSSNNAGNNRPTTTNNRPTDNYSTNNRPTDNYGTNNRPADNYGTNTRPSDNYGTNTRPTDNYGTNTRPSDNYGTNTRPSDNYGTNSRPTDNYSTNTRPADNYGTNNRPTDNYGTNNRPTDNVGTVNRPTDNAGNLGGNNNRPIDILSTGEIGGLNNFDRPKQPSKTQTNRPPTPAPAQHCVLSTTTVNGQPACKNYVIFEETFKNLDLRRWARDIRIPSHPDFEFCVFCDEPDTLWVQNDALHIRPRLTEDRFGEDFVRTGNLVLDKCTAGPTNAESCSRQAVFSYILPPTLSARINTKDSFRFRYGLLEIRAKLPLGDWIYPEILLLPYAEAYGPGISSGRVQLAMARGNRQLSYSRETRGPQLGAKRLEYGVMAGSATKILHRDANRQWADQFHNYSFLWTPETMAFSVDGVELGIIRPESYGGLLRSDNSRDPWSNGDLLAPFDKEFYLSLGLAVGGVRTFPDDTVTGSVTGSVTSGGEGNDKPWSNTDAKAMLRFWNAKDQWYPTWGNRSELIIESIRITALNH